MDQAQKVIELLGQIENYQAQMQLLEMDQRAEFERITAPIRDELAALEAEYSGKLETASAKIDQLKEQVKQEMLSMPNPETIRGSSLMAVYKRGRDEWNTDLLKGLALKIPEIGACHSVGKPVIAIMVIRK